MMKKSSILTKFEFGVPASILMLSHNITKVYRAYQEHLPLMRMTIDFEAGLLKLNGDWEYMVTANTCNKPSAINFHAGRVYIETSIFHSAAIDLDDDSMERITLPLKGSISDAETLNYCSGSLIIKKLRDKKGHAGKNWIMHVYLYDMQYKGCELQFSFPVYQCPPMVHLN